MEREWKIGYGGMDGNDFAVIVNQDNEQICTLEPGAYTKERTIIIANTLKMRDALRNAVRFLERNLPSATAVQVNTWNEAIRMAREALPHQHSFECIDASGRCRITGEI